MKTSLLLYVCVLETIIFSNVLTAPPVIKQNLELLRLPKHLPKPGEVEVHQSEEEISQGATGFAQSYAKDIQGATGFARSEIGNTLEGAPSFHFEKAKNKECVCPESFDLTNFEDEEIALITKTEKLAIYDSEDLSIEDNSEVQAYHIIYKSIIPIEFPFEYRKILLWSIYNSLINKKLTVGKAEFKNAAEHITNLLNKIFLGRNPTEYQTDEDALAIIKKSPEIYQIFISNPSLFFKKAKTWSCLPLLDQFKRLQYDWGNISDELNSKSKIDGFRDEYRKTIAEHKSLIKLCKDSRYIFHMLANFISDFKKILKETGDYALTRYVINEVLILFPLENYHENWDVVKKNMLSHILRTRPRFVKEVRRSLINTNLYKSTDLSRKTVYAIQRILTESAV